MAKIDIVCSTSDDSLMNISLTPELDDAVRRKVASGLYNNSSEVIREALRQYFLREQENEWIAREAAIGYAQLEAGEVRRVATKKEFEELLRSQG
jgi:antitoxin ParD1/3/4